MKIEDKTGERRRDDELIEARQAIVNELIQQKNIGPIFIYYPTIIEALDELLERRK